MKSLRLASLSLACALLAGCAWFGSSAPETPVAGVISEQVQTVTATVEKIDLAKRHVTLRGADGKPVMITVGEEVRNLPQVKPGDVVTIDYYESVAYEVKKPGTAEPGLSAVSSAARAKPGEKPAGIGAREVTLTTTIKEIDKKTPSVTLEGPEGGVVTVKVRDREKLERVAVGDLVEITFTEAFGVKVEPAAK